MVEYMRERERSDKFHCSQLFREIVKVEEPLVLEPPANFAWNKITGNYHVYYYPHISVNNATKQFQSEANPINQYLPQTMKR